MGANLVDEDYRGRFTASGTVLENASHGPQLCLGAVMMSLPPQCGGPDIVGWSWDGLVHADDRGTRSGSYVVVGHFDGVRFTLTEPATAWEPPDQPPQPPQPGRPAGDEQLRTPCPEPSGGWRPVDPATATREAFGRLVETAQADPGYSALWIDQNLPPGAADPMDNDPARVIVNVATTTDTARLERTLRSVWGGSLCVSRGRRSDADLARIQRALQAVPGMLMSSRDGRKGQVDLTVIRATRQLQAHCDAIYGPGTVNLVGALTPIDLRDHQPRRSSG